MKIKPLGFYVLVEMVEVEKVSAGGIILNSNEVAREQDATDVGYVRAIGPTAYVGYPGCEAGDGGMPFAVTENEEGKPTQFKYRPHIKPAECWGLKVGQKIEYRRYEGKKSAMPDYENYRYIPDSHIIGAIDEDE